MAEILDQASSPDLSAVSAQADAPRAFGYKMCWLAIKTENTDAVVNAIELTEPQASNWESGLKVAYQGFTSYAFVTPPVDGWTFVVSAALPEVNKTGEKKAAFESFVQRLGSQFDEVCYFGTHRVVEYHAWAKVQKGKIVRGYGYVGESGETLYDVGDKTKEEQALGFNFFDERSVEAKDEKYFEREDLTFPDESDVMKIAGNWSIDPTSLDSYSTQKGVGRIGRINAGSMGE